MREDEMTATLYPIAVASLLASSAVSAADSGPTDPQIAHIAYTAGNIDIEAAEFALRKSKSSAVREFASQMVRDHTAVNDKALALVKRLHVAPEQNATSKSLTDRAAQTRTKLEKLHGTAFDRAYVANEAAYHNAVNGALKTTLIPSADNAELKSLLETGLTLFSEHQKHAEHLSARLK
jgi:putative membrane protein